MSYFRRVAMQSALDVAGASVAPDAAGALAGATVPAAASEAAAGEPADIVELDAVTDTDARPIGAGDPVHAGPLRSEAPVLPADGPPSRTAASADLTAPAPGTPAAPPQPRSAPEPRTDGDGPAPAPAAPDEQLAHVVGLAREWIVQGVRAAAVSESTHESSDGAAAALDTEQAAGDDRRRPDVPVAAAAPSPAAQRPRQAQRPQAPAADGVTVGSFETSLAPAFAEDDTPPGPIPGRAAAGDDPRPRHPGATTAAPMDVVEISIGTISVSIEGPPPAPMAAATPTTAPPAPPPSRERPSDRLARHYIR